MGAAVARRVRDTPAAPRTAGFARALRSRRRAAAHRRGGRARNRTRSQFWCGCSWWECRAARSRVTFATSSIRKRSSSSEARTPSIARHSDRRRELRWPPVAGYLVSPLTLLPVGVADIVMVLLGLACFALALWLVGVRDWRVYGVVALWPSSRRDARFAPDAGPRRAARGRVEVEGPGRGPRRARRFRCRREVLRLAARRLARGDPTVARHPSCDGGRRRVATPRAPVHLTPQLRACALAAGRRLRRRQLQHLRTDGPGGGERQRRAPGSSSSASFSSPASGGTRASRSRSEPRSSSPRSPGSTTTRSPPCRSPSCDRVTGSGSCLS